MATLRAIHPIWRSDSTYVQDANPPAQTIHVGEEPPDHSSNETDPHGAHAVCHTCTPNNCGVVGRLTPAGEPEAPSWSHAREMPNGNVFLGLQDMAALRGNLATHRRLARVCRRSPHSLTVFECPSVRLGHEVHYTAVGSSISRGRFGRHRKAGAAGVKPGSAMV